MSLEEARCAVVNAARALKRQYPLLDAREWARPALEQLYAAVDAVDAVGDAEAVHVRSVFCASPECWRYADLPTGTCYHHSAWAARPSTREVRDG